MLQSSYAIRGGRAAVVLALGALAASATPAAPEVPSAGGLLLLAYPKLAQFQAMTPNTSVALYRAAFAAGDQVRLVFRGPAHLRLALFDRSSGRPIIGPGGQPVTLTYAGDLGPKPKSLADLGSYYQATHTMTLAVPVNVPDAVLLVKNPDAHTTAIGYEIFTRPRLTHLTNPVLSSLPGPSRIITSGPGPGQVTVRFTLRNMSDAPVFAGSSIQAVDTTNLDRPVARQPPFALLGPPRPVPALAPRGSVAESFVIPATTRRVSFWTTAVFYGEWNYAGFTILNAAEPAAR